MQQTLVRRQLSPNFVVSTKQIIQLSKGNYYRDIILRYTGAITCIAGSNTRANTGRGDEWSLLTNIRVIANSSDVLLDISGSNLWAINRDFLGTNPKVTSAIGDGATANPSWDSCLIIPFWMFRNAKAGDGQFDSGNLRDFRIEFTFGTFTTVNSAATAFTTTPNVTVTSYEAEDTDPDFTPLYVPRIVTSSKTLGAAVSADRFQLDIGPSYRGFLINILESTGVTETPGILTNIKLVSSSRIFREYDEQTLWQYGVMRHDLPFGQVAQAAGVTDNAIRQSTKNNHKANYSLDLCPDGFMSEAINTKNFDDFYFEVATNAAYVMEVISYQLLAPPGKRKAA